ncbi:MAG: hypothetical protein O9972_24340, partial [Burkholderiales bacterium]|nr:hypothetical protein [Burkholderiales bacterium]
SCGRSQESILMQYSANVQHSRGYPIIVSSPLCHYYATSLLSFLLKLTPMASIAPLQNRPAFGRERKGKRKNRE